MLLAVIVAIAVMALGASSASAAVTFDGNFENGLTPWKHGGGGAQCANYGTPSKSPRLRGTFYLSSNEGEGTTGQSGHFSLPANTYGAQYPLVACDLVTASQPDIVPADDYYGLMLWVPPGFTIANKSFWGVNIEELHFVGVVGAPVSLQLHDDHVTLALETGPCNMSSTPRGCQWRSNADNIGCRNASSYSCLPGYYVIPPGALVKGAWNEMILGIHWAADSSGQIQTWYRVKGAATWNRGSTMSGHPTVQWNETSGCCAAKYVDAIEAYTAALSAPLDIWLDNDIVGTDFASVAGTMPGGSPLRPGGLGGPGGGSGVRPHISALHISPRAFAFSGRRVGRRCMTARRANRARARCKREPNFTVSYVLSTRATVVFTVTELVTGRSVRGRCVSPSRVHGRGRRCERHVKVPGTIVRRGGAGLDAFRFAGRTDRQRLGPGSYILTATPIGAARAGRPASLRFSLLP
jgi:hypothetical protein